MDVTALYRRSHSHLRVKNSRTTTGTGPDSKDHCPIHRVTPPLLQFPYRLWPRPTVAPPSRGRGHGSASEDRSQRRIRGVSQ